ncbi:MAG TPA: hypothetical protein VG456_19095 [Candidatus Sulfopaludibacter sp.]|jgi:hypothetical protein|nr:hypothetical protein [Candidatus Sulfopaludibacter sp.]
MTCGILDGLSAVALTLYRHAAIPRMFQGIASGLLGPAAFQGGAATAVLGALVHFCVAFGAATTFYFASQSLPVLLRRPLVSGVIFGILVDLVMTFVVIPLSRIGYRPPVAVPFIRQLIIHMVIVGPSIALMTAKCARKHSR